MLNKKRAAIFHGTSSSPKSNWIPWLKDQLEKAGYDVFVPQLPDCDRPDRSKYEAFLQHSGWDFSDSVMIGHSSGSTTMLNLLQSDWCPKIEAAIFVGLFVNNDKLDEEYPEWYQVGQFDALFPEAFDWNRVRLRARYRAIIHGDNDPYCAYGDAVEAARLMEAELITVQDGKHLSEGSGGVSELPWAMEFLRANGIILSEDYAS